MAGIVNRVISETSAVLKAADRQTGAVLKKFGAFLMTTARRSIRSGKKPSRPGQPPHAHGKSPLKTFLRFNYDASRQSVITGVERLPGKIGQAPAALEHSGPTKVLTGPRGRRVVKTVTMAARPFMGPAAAKEVKQLPALWANSVKG